MANEEKSNLWKIRHTCEHVFNQAVEEIYPGKILRAMGPPTDDGWYNDSRYVDLKISDEDFPKIEKRMQEIIDADLPMIYKEISAEEARKIFAHNPFKLEFIEEFAGNGEKISLYYTGDPEKGEDQFVDLCRGPHADSTGQIRAFKLLSIAGAYWRGNEENEMLTRVYGTAFESQKELDDYIFMIEEAKKRDHRKLGQEMDLFLFSDLVGGGLPMWTPKGTLLRTQLDNFVWELRKSKGYQRVTIPHITKRGLYETSGHWVLYGDDLFKIKTREGHEFAMKPMNCPHHTQIYAHIQRSYRDLPQRYAETTMVYRDEQSGELSGLSRVRCITQDDAHVFLRKVQIREEIDAIWDIVSSFYSAFGMNLKVRLSFRDLENREKYLGDDSVWDEAEKNMEEIAKAHNADYFVARGEAAFYAPKLDFMAYDSIGREWQVATIQLDMNMPERFDLFCINEEGEKERIYMLHAAIMGSIERFTSVLIEHLAGKFPTWISPVQVKVIPVSDKFAKYAAEVDQFLELAGKKMGVEVRSEIDIRAERMQARIRDAEVEKIPYILIVGGKEEESKTVSVRVRGKGDQGAIPLEQFAEKLIDEIKERKLELWE